MTSGVEHDWAVLMPAICERMTQGEPLAAICRDLKISRRTVYQQRDANPAYAEQMQDARDDGYDAIASACLDIADDGSRDYIQTTDGREVPDHDHISRSKLRIETRLKLLAKWDPKRYGDKQQLEHTGPGGGPIQTITSPVSAEELRTLAAGMVDKV